MKYASKVITAMLFILFTSLSFAGNGGGDNNIINHIVFFGNDDHNSDNSGYDDKFGIQNNSKAIKREREQSEIAAKLLQPVSQIDDYLMTLESNNDAARFLYDSFWTKYEGIAWEDIPNSARTEYELQMTFLKTKDLVNLTKARERAAIVAYMLRAKAAYQSYNARLTGIHESTQCDFSFKEAKGDKVGKINLDEKINEVLKKVAADCEKQLAESVKESVIAYTKEIQKYRKDFVDSRNDYSKDVTEDHTDNLDVMGRDKAVTDRRVKPKRGYPSMR